ncbi:MAG: hypothetical protein A2X83_13190 [Desulfuromonadales bacterium GWD2_54_10]|nr:MAG: hypothetical protein A2X83_13190 [Desulfuromonadales bacterium GWD2_54_10]
MSLVGNLEDLGLGEILQIVSLSRKTGVLSLQSRGREGAVVFRQGQVVRATSSTYQQSLGEVLIQKGVIHLSSLRKALALQQESGFRERLGVILIKNFGIAQEVIEEVVCEQIENVVFSLFAWIEGRFEFEIQEHIETVDDTKLDPLQFMLDQGLNPQFLAMEGTRILDEQRHAIETASVAAENCSNAADLVAEARVPVNSHPMVKHSLVIVDDDGPTLQVLVAGLRENGFDVHAMTRSEDTLIKVDNLCRSGIHPTVLIDLIMPKMDGSGVLGGIELLELLHNNFKELPIIMMSDYQHSDAEVKVSGMGYPFIMKPRRAELNTLKALQNFLSLLLPLIRCAESGGTLPRWQERFNLGEELRLEMKDDDILAPLKKMQCSGLSLLRGMLEELTNPELQGGELLLVLRFASEYLNRAVVFMMNNNLISGIGQFGISGSTFGGDDKVSTIHFALETGSMFMEPYRTACAHKIKPVPASVDSVVFEQLGSGVPEEVFIGPIISQSRVIGFLYGDNLPDKNPIGDTETLEIFLSQAGIAMEKSIFDRQLL